MSSLAAPSKDPSKISNVYSTPVLRELEKFYLQVTSTVDYGFASSRTERTTKARSTCGRSYPPSWHQTDSKHDGFNVHYAGTRHGWPRARGCCSISTKEDSILNTSTEADFRLVNALGGESTCTTVLVLQYLYEYQH